MIGHKKDRKVLIRFLGYLKPYRKTEILVLFLMGVVSLCVIVSPYLLKTLIDDVIPSRDVNKLLLLIGVLVSINVIRVIIEGYASYLNAYVNEKISVNLRQDLFNHVMRLPLGYFNGNKKGDLVHRIHTEVARLQDAIAGTIIAGIYLFFSITGGMVALAFLNIRLFLISITVLPLIYLSIKYFVPRLQTLSDRIHGEEGMFMSHIVERVENVILVKSYNNYELESDLLFKKGSSLMNMNLDSARLSSYYETAIKFLVTVSPFMIFGAGAYMIINGFLTIGALVAFYQYLQSIFTRYQNAILMQTNLIDFWAALKRLFSLLDEEQEVGANRGKEVTFKRAIQLSGIGFSYQSNALFGDINLVFEKGKKYAIVGKSGAGKSSLARILCGFYQVNEGIVAMDGIDYQDIHVDSIRRNITYVHQDSQIFHDTVINNLRYGAPKCGMDEAENITEKCHLLHDICDFDKKFEEIVGDQGVRMSGGQKQRLTIARAILRNSPIIILDEVTSAIDSQTEQVIWDALQGVLMDKTVIAISHRLSTIRNFDEIIFMENGRIVEQGNFDELIRSERHFYNAVSAQAL